MRFETLTEAETHIKAFGHRKDLKSHPEVAPQQEAVSHCTCALPHHSEGSWG